MTPMTVDEDGVGTLSRAECLGLISHATFGRIGISSGALPMVLPVNFRLVGERIVFRTGVGTKLDAATRNAVVAFEVDEIDPMSHAGWSVVVTGVASPVTDPTDLALLTEANIPRWAASDTDQVIEVPVTMVTGRRVGTQR